MTSRRVYKFSVLQGVKNIMVAAELPFTDDVTYFLPECLSVAEDGHWDSDISIRTIPAAILRQGE
ncbi:hypothetical protein AVEN_181369-1, partial [Araneus ventricosus]